MRHTPPYIELHCHSAFSFLDGASHPEELVLRARELGYPALALTDHDGLYGSMEFAQVARAEGLQPITGCEITLADPEGPPPPLLERWDPDAPPDPDDPGVGTASVFRPHLTLLAETPTGYATLCRLISEARAHHRRDPWLPLESLLARNEGLIVLSGCRNGPLARALERSVADGEAVARRLRDALGPDRFFVELQVNQARGEAPRNRALARLADRMGLPVVATGNVHYHHPDRARLQDVLVAVRHRTTLDGAHAVRRPNRNYALAAPDEMAWRFRGRPDALASTLRIAERCAAFDLTQDLGYSFPDFEGSEHGSAAWVLHQVTAAMLDEKYPPGSRLREEATRRLEQELALVERHGLSGFFLVYRDILNLGREVAARVRGAAPRATSNLPPGRGRGSSVSSIICYLIGLSHIDPVANDLFLGRFLNEAMSSVPDIDLDFARDIREELILAVYAKYGNEHAGLVCTFPTYRLRSAVRDVGKALDLPLGDIEKVAKVAERHTALEEEFERIPELKDRKDSPLWKHLAELARQVKGLPRHVSQHVGGMIISSRPLVEIVPLEPAAWEGRVLCQWDKDSCDDARFIKIDFLALGMLSLVEESMDLIAERHGRAPDLSRIDFADPVVYDRICAGDTVGMFQVESRAQIQMLRRSQPRTLEELSIQVAIVRPGPIVAGAVNPYVRRREQLRENPDFKIPYDHPLLEEALHDTLGVIIFQDQVLLVCRALAGFTDGQAEGLRRAMSRKRSRDAMRSYWEAFREGAARRGVGEEISRAVFQQVVAFSEFGFPKSHAAAFGLLAYQSAWLRHYYATEYYVALFNNQPMGFYSLDALVRDARRNGIRIHLPDLNRSAVACTAEEQDLRVGLGFVRGWGADIAEAVVRERDARGAFRSLVDFLRRTPSALKRPAIENLIWVGGMDSLGLSRRELLWQVGLWLGPESDTRRTTERENHAQLGLDLDDAATRHRFAQVDDRDRLLAEYRMLRFSTAQHPLLFVRDALPADRMLADRFDTVRQHATVTVAGVVVARQRPQTANGFTFILMEDETGPINVIVQPDIYERDRMVVRMEPFILVRGRLRKDGANTNVVAYEVRSLRSEGARADLPEEGPPTLEYWGAAPSASGPAPTRFLSALRSSPPDVKSFG
ncbi:MAG: DNA polymerase III subunit alpha [Gemmatimonadota bacterium]